MSPIAIHSTAPVSEKETPAFLFLFSLLLAASVLIPPLLFVLPVLFYLLLDCFFRQFSPLIMPEPEHILCPASPRSPPY